jgi:hypothetical protein
VNDQSNRRLVVPTGRRSSRTSRPRRFRTPDAFLRWRLMTIWLPRWSPTRRVAAVMFLVGVVGVVLWCTTDSLRAWIPNITIGAGTVGLTITVVDRAIRREARERLLPRLEGAVSSIGTDFQMMLLAVARDYSSTHLDTFTPIPKDGVVLIEQWIDSRDEVDASRRRSDDGSPALLSSARELAAQLASARERDRDVLEPRLVRAMDDFCLSVENRRTRSLNSSWIRTRAPTPKNWRF